MSDREAIQIEMQIRYEELCEKCWPTSFELFKDAYQRGKGVALAQANEVIYECNEKSQANKRQAEPD